MLPFTRKRLFIALVFFSCAVFALAKLGPAGNAEMGPVADPNTAAAGATPTVTLTATATATPSNATVQFSSATYNTNEPETAVITITRTGDISGTNTVFFTIADGTATGGSSCMSGIDYVRSGQPIDFGPGQASVTVNIPICSDAITEPDETVNVGLYAFNTTIGTPSFAVLTIHDPATATPTNTPTATNTPTPNPPITVTLPNLTVGPGSLAIVPITVGETTGRGIISYDLQVTFNPAVIQPANPPFDSTGTLSSSMVITPNAANAGHLIISAFQTSPLTGSGTLLNLRFNVVNNSSLATTLVFENYNDHPGFVWNEGNPPASTANGSVYIVGETPTATASPTPTCVFGNFANPSPITIDDNAAGSPYPSTIAVSGLVGTITKVTIGLTGVSHTFPDDIDVMLVGPGGQSMLLISDAGGEWDVTNLTLTFDDAALPALPDSTRIAGGMFKPTNFDTASDIFPAPAPSPGATDALSVFNRLDPNGIWSLYVRDDAWIDIGSISGGWTLHITTTGTLCGDTPTATPTPTSTMTNTPVPTPSETPGGFHYHQFSDSTYFEDESQTAVITITRSGDTSIASQVVFWQSNGTGVGSGENCATGADYLGRVQIVPFGPGEIAKTVGLLICPDIVTEADETINLHLGPDVGTRSSAVLKINDTATAFRNATNIAINLGSSSVPYPSNITVSGGPTTIGSMRITIYDFASFFPQRVHFLLVGPTGQNFVLLANAGVSTEGGPVTLNLNDTAQAVVPETGPLTTGDFEPTSYGTVGGFAPPAPAGPYNLPGGTIGGTGTQTLFGNFGGTNPNGTWSLYLRNNGAVQGVIGNVAGGWGLEFIGTTAANASISGRVTTTDGLGIRNAKVVVTGNSLSSPIIATTGSFGYFMFEGLATGETYVLTVNSKRYTFSTPSRVISLVDNVIDADFIADPQE